MDERETMMQLNKFHLGESVHNRESNELGKVVGFRDTEGIPQYQVLVPIEPISADAGCSLKLWPETVLESSPYSA